jgi:hypothetical protein
VRGGLALLAARKRERGLAEPAIGLAVTILQSTIGAIDGVFRLYRELGLDGGIVAQRLQPMPVYRQHYDAAMAAELLDAGSVQQFGAIRQALVRHAPVPRADAFFYYALFEGFDPRRGTCPWLARGAYLAADGSMTACCFMKDAAHASASPAELRRALDAGEVPKDCAGCGTAMAVAAARRG